MIKQTTAASVETSAAKQKKIDTVSSLTDKVNRAKAIVLTDYRGLKHKQFEEIRKVLKKLDAELVVAKNRLLKRALGNKKTATLEQTLSEPTATLFSYADEVAPLKALLKFFKATATGKAKAGLLGSQSLSSSDVERLANLPTRDALLGQLAGALNAPIQGLHYALSWNLTAFLYALNAVKGKKST